MMMYHAHSEAVTASILLQDGDTMDLENNKHLYGYVSPYLLRQAEGTGSTK